jgi:hypothetical protein
VDDSSHRPCARGGGGCNNFKSTMDTRMGKLPAQSATDRHLVRGLWSRRKHDLEISSDGAFELLKVIGSLWESKK